MVDSVELTVIRVGLPQSNVMLVDCKGRDHGGLESMEILITVTDAFSWQSEVWCKMRNLSTT